jgi:lipoprotein NlpI
MTLPSFFARGNVNFYLARFSAASADYQQSLKLNTAQPYAVIWLHLARKRMGEDDTQDLTQRATKLESTRWPAPVVKFFLGQMTSDQLMAAAASGSPGEVKDQHCGAAFYLAEDALLREDRTAATAQFKIARDVCAKTFNEYREAVSELKGLESGAHAAKKVQ